MNRSFGGFLIIALVAALMANYLINQKRKAEVQAQNWQRSSERASSQDEIEKQKTQIEELRTRVGKQKQKLAKIYRQMERAKSADHEVDVSTPADDYQRQFEIVKDLGQRIAELSDQEEALKSQRASSTPSDATSDLDNQINQLEVSTAALGAQIETLKHLHPHDADATSQLNILYPQRDSQRAALLQLRQQRKSIQDQLPARRGDRNSDARAAVTDIRQKRVELQTQMRQERLTLQNLKKQVDSAELRDESSNKNVAELENEYKNLSLDIDQLQQELNQQRTNLRSLSSKRPQ